MQFTTVFYDLKRYLLVQSSSVTNTCLCNLKSIKNGIKKFIIICLKTLAVINSLLNYLICNLLFYRGCEIFTKIVKISRLAPATPAQLHLVIKISEPSLSFFGIKTSLSALHSKRFKLVKKENILSNF